MEDVFDFAKKEHKRQVTHHKVEGNPKTKYTMLAKLMEELGELSEAILTQDLLQRKSKLGKNKQHLEEEFADVLLVTLILANELKVDMKSALNNKMIKIKARKY